MWPFKNPDEAFCDAVRLEFAPLAQEFGTSLKKVAPLIFGFRTQYAVMTVGAYPGHFRSICVKIRSSGNEEAVSVKDGIDVGLANIELFVTGKMSEIYQERQQWAPAPIRKEIEALAKKVREVAMPFLGTANADWDGLRDMIAAKISKAFEEKPWLRKYTKNT